MRRTMKGKCVLEGEVTYPMDYVVGQMAMWLLWQPISPLIRDKDLACVGLLPEWIKVGREWSRDHRFPFENAVIMLRHFKRMFGEDWSPVEVRLVLDEALLEAEKMVMIDNRRK